MKQMLSDYFYRVALALGLALGTTSCGSEAASTALGMAMNFAMQEVAKAVRDRTGNDLSRYHTECEHEFNPDTNKFLVLCEVDLNKVVSP